MRVSCIAAAAAILFVPLNATANGRFPASNQIVLSPADANLLVLRTTFGVLVSHDHGKTWDWLCEAALGFSSQSTQDPGIALTASGALLVGLVAPQMGLDVSADTGCNFVCVAGALTNQAIIDLAVRPDSPHSAVVLTGSAGDSGASTTQVFESADDGAHWAPMGAPIDPTVVPTTIDVAARDPQRLYVSATRGFTSARTASLFVSMDGGATWTERITPFDPRMDGGTDRGPDAAIYIGAVDPTNPDRVYVRTSGSPSRLFVTSDAGRSFQVVSLPLTGTMLGFALAPDGSTVFAGGPDDGLFVASSADLSFRKVASLPVQCLAASASELWACSDEPSGFIAGVSKDQGMTFDPSLHLNGIRGPIACRTANGGAACGADANASQCSGVTFETFCGNLGGCADAGTAPSSVPHSSGGCSFGDGAAGAGAAAGLAVGALWALISKRRRRH